MKKSRIILLVSCLLLGLSGCSNSKNESGDSKDSSIHNTSDDSPVSICSFSNEEISKKINSYDNLRASENLFVNIPEESNLYEYISKVSTDYNYKEYYDQFLAIFNFLFPDHKLNEEYLFYSGGDSDIEYDDEGNVIKDLNNVKDYRDELESGKQGRATLLYDETWKGDVTEWNSQVCLELGAPFGYGYATINKGNTVFYMGKIYDETKGIKRYPGLESFDPIDFFEVIDTYSPNSTESFKLMDKEMAINDAVTFFENYVNSLPYPESPTLNVTVREVMVLEIKEGVYGYYFVTSAEYDKVPFDYKRSGTAYSVLSEYSSSIGNGFMLKSDDVDVVSSLRRIQEIESPSKINDIVSLDEALQIASKAMTSNVVFEVQKAELVYREQLIYDSEGQLDTETMPRNVSPAWKFTLYNTNDKLTYVFYVDVKEGNYNFDITDANLGVKS